MRKSIFVGAGLIALSIGLTFAITLSPKAEDTGFDITGGIITGYHGTETDIVIPTDDGSGNAVTGIADNAFQDSSITSVVIGDNITSIGDGAFSGSSDLVSVDISGATGLLNIGDNFISGTSVSNLFIPDSYNGTISSNTVAGATSLNRVDVSGSNVTYTTDENGWVYSAGGTLVAVPWATQLADGEERFTVANSTKEIAQGVFNNTTVTELNVPDTLTKVGSQGNTQLITLYGSENNTELQSYVVEYNATYGMWLAYKVLSDGSVDPTPTPVPPGPTPTPTPTPSGGGGGDSGSGDSGSSNPDVTSGQVATTTQATTYIDPATGKTKVKTYVVAADGTVHEKDYTPTTADGFDKRYLLCIAMFLAGVAAFFLSMQKKTEYISERM